MRARRFKIPVLSRLTWAWLGFGALGAGLIAFSAFDGGRTKAAVAMAVEGIERLAPPIDPAIEEERPERLATRATAVSPTLVEDLTTEPYAVETEDTLGDIGEAAPAPEDPAADIMITVDGAPARAIGGKPASATAAAATPIAAPDAALLKRSAYGQVPRIAVDGRRPSKLYAQSFTPGKNPSVALIVGGLGLNRALTERAIDDLPPRVTLAFAPYAKDLPFWTKRARDAGHELMIEIPMENRSGDGEALGPAALLTSRTAEENAQRLDWILSRFPGYFGATNYLGVKFSGDRDAMDFLLARLDAAGLAYVDDTGSLGAGARNGESTIIDRLIDPGYRERDGRAKRDLEALEAIAARNGDALGKTYVHDATLDDIAQWAHSLDERGLTLAPASAVLATRMGER